MTQGLNYYILGVDIGGMTVADTKKGPLESDPLAIRLVSDNIVVTKLFSEYCNAILSVVHELHTALFQCSSPLFPLAYYKVTVFYSIHDTTER